MNFIVFFMELTLMINMSKEFFNYFYQHIFHCLIETVISVKWRNISKNCFLSLHIIYNTIVTTSCNKIGDYFSNQAGPFNIEWFFWINFHYCLY